MYYQLFDYDSSKWFQIEETLNEYKINSLNDIKSLIKNLGNFDEDIELKTLDAISDDFYSENELVEIFNEIRKYALNLPNEIPLGKIARLNQTCLLVELTRSQVLCILCHMILCTLQKSQKNFYWVTFQNWLTHGRSCSIAYLHTLMKYFQQSFKNEKCVLKEFRDEKIQFKRNVGDLEKLKILLKSESIDLSQIELQSNGSIGDEINTVEVDFANADIGYGITGTQEEMIFGSSPELCIAMLFCDTLTDSEAICIIGARRVAFFDGYGLDIKVKSFLSLYNQNWSNRIVLAIDALCFSDDIEESLKEQLEEKNLYRELLKAYNGFRLVGETVKTISTGHWGCGCFNGDKYLKALIQLTAASLATTNLIFYSFHDFEFVTNFDKILTKLKNLNYKVARLWDLILSLNNNKLENDKIFESLMLEIENK